MKKNIFLLVLLSLFGLILNAQNDTMYVMKNGEVVVQYNVNTEVDSIIFYKPTNLIGKLEVQTNLPASQTETTIVCSGTIVSNTAGLILEKGFVYGLSIDPTFDDAKVVSNTVGNMFFANISGLNSGTFIHIRAYAINATDTVYGNDLYTSTLACFNCTPGGGEIIAYKPNIYIYPTETIQLSVTLSFPLGGKILTSIPEYNTGWNVTVEPNGKIDNEYTYLFYESYQANVWQTKAGWHVTQSELTQFFTSNMAGYGFNEQEINDFLDYWIPLFKDKAYYTIYPQTNVNIDKAIKINLSKSPDKIMRLFYLVKGFDNEPLNELEKPVIPTFERSGFYVAEWGVLL